MIIKFSFVFLSLKLDRGTEKQDTKKTTMKTR